MPKQFIRNDGNVIIAEDFETTSGVKLSETAASEGSIADGAVTTGKIADGAVTSGKLDSGAVATNLGFTPENNSNKKTSLSDDSDTYYPSQKAVKTAVDAKEDALGFTPENTSNKSTDGTLASNSDTLFPSEKAVKTYVDAHGGGGPIRGLRNVITNPLAAATNNMVNAHLADGTTVVPLVQPDTPRTLQMRASGAATDDVTFHGTDYNDAVISETKALNGTNKVETDRAFKTVTGVDLPTGAYNVSVGFDIHLGLSHTMDVPAVYLQQEFTTADLSGNIVTPVNSTPGFHMSFDPVVLSKNWFEANQGPDGTLTEVIYFYTN